VHCGRVKEQHRQEDKPAQDHLGGLAEQGKISDGPRSASTTRRSPSAAVSSIFRSTRVFASTASLSARLLRLASLRSSSAARSLPVAASAAACALMAAAVRGVLALGAFAALRICGPSASPADRYSKGLAETENKAKEEAGLHNNGDFNVTQA